MRETDIGLGHTGDSHRENHQNIFVDEHDHRIISNEAALKNSNIKCFLKSISEKTTSHWPLKCTEWCSCSGKGLLGNGCQSALLISTGKGVKTREIQLKFDFIPLHF